MPNSDQLHKEAVKLLIAVKDAKKRSSDYNKRRREATEALRPVLTEIWEAFGRGETVGSATTKKEWCKRQGITIRRVQQIITGPKPPQAKSLRLKQGMLVTIGDRKFMVAAMTNLNPCPGIPNYDNVVSLNLRETTDPNADSKMVVHVNDAPYDVYIGRKHNRGGQSFPASIWGNHDKLPLDEYEKQVRSNLALMAKLPELKGKVLGCWHRSPRNGECHGDVLLKLTDEVCADGVKPVTPANSPFGYKPNFYSVEEAKQLENACAKLDIVRQETGWERNGIRLKKRYAVIAYTTNLDTKVHNAEMRPISEAPDEIKRLRATLSAQEGIDINWLAIVRYEDGNDYMNYHRHKEDWGNEDQRVWIVSTGAERPFAVKDIATNEVTKFIAQGGSLITLSHEANTTHEHKVPKCSTCTTPRYAVNCKALPTSTSQAEGQQAIATAPGQSIAPTPSASVADAEGKNLIRVSAVQGTGAGESHN